jgi:hypothetical protein
MEGLSMSVKEIQEKIAANMKKWQKVENASVASTGAVIAKTENPIVRIVMEIIQQDSQMHYRVQEMIVNSLETSAITLSPDELGDVWGLIEKHIELEKETVKLAEDSITALEGKKGMVVQKYLLEYLLKDEEKHNKILEEMEGIKQGMYPYG